MKLNRKETRQERLIRLDKYFKTRECLGTTSEYINGTDCIIYLFAKITTHINGHSWTMGETIIVIPKYWSKVNIINSTNKLCWTSETNVTPTC